MILTPEIKSAFYFPLSRGIYEVKPGLLPLSSDFGNGAQDHRVFQLDNQFHHYRDNKLRARNEQPGKYIYPGEDNNKLARINSYMINTLATDYPDYFIYEPSARIMHCLLTDERLSFTHDYQLDKANSQFQKEVNYLNGWDALVMQVQEDIAIMDIDPRGNGTLSSIHLCAPNHWSPINKVGQNFLQVHEQVPGMEQISQRSAQINLACLNKGPFVRFAWGLSTDTRLNHHPQSPPGYDQARWQGRSFNSQKPELFLRVERQTLQGFPHQGCLLFTIRTYFHDVNELDEQQKMWLHDAIVSMNDATLAYKGLAESKHHILEWLAT